MSDQFLYEVTYKFKDKYEYEYFIEAQSEYSKLRSFCEEFERQLRSWRKYGTTPDSIKNRGPNEQWSEEDIIILDILGANIEDWYYEVKKECIDD